MTGGTGASPLSSIKHAGIPWELGLAETQQVLVMNDLRGRIRVQTDGKLQTGRDVAIAALLGAEEFGFSTTPLVAMGCIMMRKCHLNTCPVGIATQDPALRAKFQGQPENVINFFFFIAEQVRQYHGAARLPHLRRYGGPRRYARSAPGSGPLEGQRPRFLRHSLQPASARRVSPAAASITQDHGLAQALDYKLIELAGEALDNQTPHRNQAAHPQCAPHRRRHAQRRNRPRAMAPRACPTIPSASNSPARPGRASARSWPKASRSTLEGDANDYVGKGLSGGSIVVYPPRNSTFLPEENILIGNVVLYGATSGEAFFNGMAGERFAVRNSGATAVVEGLGDHGCEYMTKAWSWSWASCGRNFAAGMSGGFAYVLDETGDFAEKRCNNAAVDLEPVTDDADLILRNLIARHVEFTGSPRAKWILENWSTMLPKFVKVFPLRIQAGTETYVAGPQRQTASTRSAEVMRG